MELTHWDTGWLPRGASQWEAPPSSPWSSSASHGLLGELRRVVLQSRRLSGASCFHLLAPYSLHSLGGRFPSWRRLSTPCVPGVPLRVPKLCSYRAAPDAFLLDSKMGVPPVPEANGLRWGPVLLAVFLAASRGKVEGAWTLEQSTRRTQRVGWGRVTGRMSTLGAPSSLL